MFRKYEGAVIGRCGKCGILKTFPGNRSLFNPLGTVYQTYEKRIRVYEKMFRPLLNGVASLVPHKDLVLDVGCSTGILMRLLRKKGFAVSGIEANRNACRVAQKRFGGKSVHCGTLRSHIKKFGKPFDCIIYNHVLEHIPDPVSEIRLVRRVLRKNGILAVGVPNRDNWVFRMRGKYWESLLPNEHVWHFSVHDIVRLMKKNGFVPLRFRFEDHGRQDYPPAKRIYFFLLSLLNRLSGTGEATLIFFRKI